MSKALLTVSAPASSGNLGPGFDVFALALDLYNKVEVLPNGTGEVTIKGEGSGSLPTNSDNLVVRMFEHAANAKLSELNIDLVCTNDIPIARGLGSSTAAAACGLVAGWQFTNQEWNEDTLCSQLNGLDGHPDNAAACAYGGIVLCHDRPNVLDEESYLDVVPLGPADWLEFFVLIPDHELATEESRSVLPDSYSREDLVRAIGGSAMLSAGLIGGHLELLSDALHTDIAHEPHRAHLVPELDEVRRALKDSRALGATLSGAGPTILVWCAKDGIDQVDGTLAIEYPELTRLRLSVASHGAQIDA